MSRHTDMFRSRFSSSNGRIAVALPSSVCRRHAKPGVRSASALMRSRFAANSAMTGESIGPRITPMFNCAISYFDMAAPSLTKMDTVAQPRHAAKLRGLYEALDQAPAVGLDDAL